MSRNQCVVQLGPMLWLPTSTGCHALSGKARMCCTLGRSCPADTVETVTGAEAEWTMP